MTMLRIIHPSALHWAVVCPRRFVGMHSADQLPPTLAAVRGRILHAVREDLAAQPDRSAVGLRVAAEPAFLAARMREQARLEQGPWWMEWFDLGEHLPWRSARSFVLPSANRLADTPPLPRRSAPSAEGDAGADADGEVGISNYFDPLPGVEVRVSSADIGLRGIVDEVRPSADGWVVSEMKTTDQAASGDAATVQVLAYALALELVGAGTVAHCEVLGPRGERKVALDDGARRDISKLLERARAADESDAIPCASACGGCPVRDSCCAYREWTERQWEEGRPPGAEDDVWGVVDHVQPEDGETVVVNLTRPDGARVSVRGVPSARQGIGPGAKVAAFGLRATGTRRLHGTRAAPTALHERAVGVAQSLPAAWGASWQLRDIEARN